MKVVAVVVASFWLAMVVVAFAFPQVAAYQVTYFDLSSGRVMREWVSFGRTYKRTMEETEYSRLLRKYAVEAPPPQWKKAFQKELGIRRLFFPQNVCYPYGRVAAAAREFAVFLEFTEPGENETRELISQFRALLQKGTPKEIRDYVRALQLKRLK